MTISLDLYAFIVSQVSLVLPVCRQWYFIFVTHWRYSLPRPSSLYLSPSISRSLLCVSNYDSPCGISFSHTNTKLCLPGSHFSQLFPCVPLAHPSYIDVSLLRYENQRLFLINISFSHTNTNFVSQGLIFLHCSLVCRSHTPSLPRDILRSLVCLSSYHSCCEIYFSLTDTKLRLSGSHFSLVSVCMWLTRTLSFSLSHPHT